MIKIALRDLAERRGILNGYQLQQLIEKVTGRDISQTMIYRLWEADRTPISKIGLNTIEAVCLALECSVGDWIIVEQDKPAKKRSTPKTTKKAK